MISKAAIFFAIAFTAVISGVAFFQSSHNHSAIPAEAMTLFENWQERHGKNYGSPAEKTYRLRVFWDNILKIRDHNDSDSTYELEANLFADLTPAEFKIKYMGFKFTDRVKSYADEKSGTNPPSINWREKGAVNPVKNQKQCGSCWAFSTIAAVEAIWFLKKGTLLSLSEQQLVDCSGSYGNHGCNGGLMDYAFKYIISKGVTTESDYPYRGIDQRCKYSGHAAATISGYTDVRRDSEIALETAVAQQVVSIAVDAETWQFYSRGIYSNKNCGTQLDHGVAAIGYGAVGSEQFWIVRNSWTARWGENGYIRLIKNNGQRSGECGILLAASYPTIG